MVGGRAWSGPGIRKPARGGLPVVDHVGYSVQLAAAREAKSCEREAEQREGRRLGQLAPEFSLDGGLEVGKCCLE
jgi:hypothetical protein